MGLSVCRDRDRSGHDDAFQPGLLFRDCGDRRQSRRQQFSRRAQPDCGHRANHGRSRSAESDCRAAVDALGDGTRGPAQFAGVRLVQAAYHNRSLCLYTKLGFATRETLSKMDGAPIEERIPGYDVRRATESDLSACDSLCLRVHGHDRGGELRDAVKVGTAKLVEHMGRITGYATDIALFAHAVGETNQEIIALIASGSDLSSKRGILVPTRNGELFRWWLNNGLRLVQQMTLMTIGLYNEPLGAYLPSVLY